MNYIDKTAYKQGDNGGQAAPAIYHNHTLTVNKAIMQQSGLGACALNHPLAAGRVDCAEVSVVRVKKRGAH